MVKVNKEKCIGCGQCIAICPEVFELKNCKSQVKESSGNKKCIQESIKACPVDAISE